MNFSFKDANLSKRVLISKDSAQILIAVTAAAVLLSSSLVVMKVLLSKKTHQDKVIAAKTTARTNLNLDVQKINDLKERYKTFDTGTLVNSKIVLNALPSKYDFPAVAASLEKIVNTQTGASRYKLEAFSGLDQSTSAAPPSGSNTPMPIEFSVEVSGNYESLKLFVKDLERSIRPFTIKSMDVSGTSTSLRARLQVATYYQPEKKFEITTRSIK